MVDTRSWTTPPELLADDLTHTWFVGIDGTGSDGTRVSVTFDNTSSSSGEGYEATLMSVRVDQDLARTPSITAQVVVADVPESLVARMDARRDLTLFLHAGYRTGNDTSDDVHEVAQLKLDRITRDETGRATLYGVSREQVILDNSELDPPWETTGAPAAQVIGQLAAQVGTYIETNAVGGTQAGPATSIRAQDAWDGIQEVCNAQGWRIQITPGTGMDTVPVPTGNEASRADLTTGRTGTLIRRSTEQARTNYANKVRLVYEWRDASNVSQRIVGTWSDPTYATSGNIRTATIKRSVSTTQARANAAAAVIGARMVRRGRVYRVSAIACYWLRPGDVVTITNPDTRQPERALIESLTFSSDGTMDLTTRSTT